MTLSTSISDHIEPAVVEDELTLDEWLDTLVEAGVIVFEEDGS